MLEGVDHLAVIVHDLDASLPYFRERLGLRLVSQERLPDVGVHVTYLDLGNTLLQLVEPTQPGSLRTFLDEHGEGLHHVCFKGANVEETVGQLSADEHINIVIGGRNRRACFLRERPSGLLMELTETEPVGREAGERKARRVRNHHGTGGSRSDGSA